MSSSIICFSPVDNPKRKSFSSRAVRMVVSSISGCSIVRLDHIVPPENVLALALPSGPKNIEFEFTAANRSNTAMVLSLREHLPLRIGIALDGRTRSCSFLALLDDPRWTRGLLLLVRSSPEDLRTSGEDIRPEQVGREEEGRSGGSKSGEIRLLFSRYSWNRSVRARSIVFSRTTPSRSK